MNELLTAGIFRSGFAAKVFFCTKEPNVIFIVIILPMSWKATYLVSTLCVLALCRPKNGSSVKIALKWLWCVFRPIYGLGRSLLCCIAHPFLKDPIQLQQLQCSKKGVPYWRISPSSCTTSWSSILQEDIASKWAARSQPRGLRSETLIVAHLRSSSSWLTFILPCNWMPVLLLESQYYPGPNEEIARCHVNPLHPKLVPSKTLKAIPFCWTELLHTSILPGHLRRVVNPPGTDPILIVQYGSNHEKCYKLFLFTRSQATTI